MPGELGKCPTCKKEVSTSSESCPHCGERYFHKDVPDNENPVIKCHTCGGAAEYYDGGSAVYDSVPSKLVRPCNYCMGSGARKRIKVIDLRTGKEVGEKEGEPCARPASWGPVQSSSGCLVIIGAFLTLASTLLIAVLI